ncbi:hypothetical protein [Clostridium ganghwense]|uniref:Uncharacterized protein n=1 Tax=Clostridium ganghwense TaxID=312089 RepID=A0ABT4CMT9_9CLOT|nr:hypothetical protein [Clostridium ganghwense]MCY6369314.1 hypothetical protein [Clostridium ganghwense]
MTDDDLTRTKALEEEKRISTPGKLEIALDNAEDLDEVLSIIDNVDSENPMTVTEYSNIQFLTWQNFESTTGSSKYDDNKITKFHWYPKDDDYKF